MMMINNRPMNNWKRKMVRSQKLLGSKSFPREWVFIVSKVLPENLRHADVIKAAARSLKRLQTDFIDLYLIHIPNPQIPLKETMAALEKLVKDGLVRLIGVSNFDVEQMEEAKSCLSEHDIVVNQVEYSLHARQAEREVLPYCIRQGITIMAYTPLANGRLSTNSFLKGIGRKYGKTAAQVALNWLIAEDRVIAIPKAVKLDHVEENAGAMGWRLSEADREKVSTHFS
jgi:diketogulonate reductase-like aldo/keto reductase